MKRPFVIGLIAAVCVIGIGCAVWFLVPRPLAVVSDSLPVNQAVLSQLATANRSGIDTSHLAAGVMPPTNKWFSGFALQATPQPGFSLPGSFLPGNDQFEVGLPKVTTTQNTMFAEHVPATIVAIKSAVRYAVTRYDELSVDLTYYDAASQALGTVTIVEGSPYVFFAASTQTVQLNMSGAIDAHDSAYVRVTGAQADVAAVASRGATVSGQAISVPAKGLVTLYLLVTGQSDQLLRDHAAHRIISTQSSYQGQGSNIETTIKFTTDDNQSTIFGYLPHQHPMTSVTDSGYDTLYGRMQLALGTAMTFTTPTITETSQLDLSHLSGDQRQQLITSLRRDAASLPATPTDSYFGGKALYRMAQLLNLAHQLDQTAIAAQLHDRLVGDLSVRFTPTTSPDTPQSFYYDTKMHGIVGSPPSFGSDAFNDHHFHYGYAIYAASVVARYDQDFAKQYGPMVNLLIADIAAPAASKSLPLRRVFDPYTGHSWASGSAPFADGNNQESSSEAMNAWTAVALWGDATHNTGLQQYGEWLLSNEAASARAYWTDFDQSAPLYKNFPHTVISINWGGKRDYATFFSSAPAAMLGIQLIPMSPTMAQIVPDAARAQAQLAEAMPDGNYNQQFGDYFLMYEGLSDKKAVLQTAATLKDTSIDDADSRTYLLAWLMSQ